MDFRKLCYNTKSSQGKSVINLYIDEIFDFLRKGSLPMDLGAFYELMLDNIPDGIYILDDKGNYLYVNSAYVRNMGMSKEELMGYNAHKFKTTGQIDFCISDIVYREKRRVVMFQDVRIGNSRRNTPFRQLIISNPVFGPGGEVQNIIAICKPLDSLNDFYNEAMAGVNVRSSFYNTKDTPRQENESVVAESLDMKELLRVAKEIANVDTPVLISGESGTGKEIIAQYIHKNSRFFDREMVAINCASLPENLLEAELFGYEKGAFTGASSTGKKGLIEVADGSTLFLDEINSMPLSMQGKLLRALETKTILRIGSTKPKKVNFRLISATNEDIINAVEEKRFRTDLFYRINVIHLKLTPLRERQDDIVPLALHFLDLYNKKYTKSKAFAEKTIQEMLRYDWPGNVRELKNFVERSVVMSASDYIEITNIHEITASHDSRLRFDNQQPPWAHNYNIAKSCNIQMPKHRQLFDQGLTLQEYIARCEREYIQYALDTYKSSYAAADALGTSQSSIMRRKRKYSIP